MGEPQPVETFDPLATVLLYRDTGVTSRDDGGPAALVDEVTVWVYADRSVFGMVTRRMVIRGDQVLTDRSFEGPLLTQLTDAEEASVRFEAGVGLGHAPELAPRWARLDGEEARPWIC